MKIICLLAILMLAAVATASYSQGSLNSFLRSYNITNSTIQSLAPLNLTYLNANYILLYKNGLAGTPYLLINATNGFSFIINATRIALITRNATISSAINGINFTTLSVLMKGYLNSSASPINNCLISTGLDRATCTIQNSCQSCQLVPSCSKAPGNPLYNAGGPGGAFALGIAAFGGAYNRLQANASLFYNYTAGINRSNYVRYFAAINTSFNTIYNITNNLYMNPIFPPLASSDYTKCTPAGYGTTNVTTAGPWYCNAVGYCQFLTYNYTTLNNTKYLISRISGELPTNSVILSIATNVSNIENIFITPLLYKQKSAQLSVALNISLRSYGAITNRTQTLLSHISNNTLAVLLASLQRNYSNLKTNFINLNISAYNRTLSRKLANLTVLYNSINATYAAILGQARNNTALILIGQLNAQNPPGQSSSLAFAQLGLDSLISSKISNTVDVQNKLAAINSNASALTGQSSLLVEAARAADGAFAALLNKGLNMPYSAILSIIPLIAIIPPVIVGIVALLLLFRIYVKMKKKQRIVINERTVRNWRFVFIILVLVVAAYSVAAYVYAGAANAYAPYSAFRSAFRGSKSLVIMVNSTASNSTLGCANRLAVTAKNLGKTVSTVNLAGGFCRIGSSVQSYDSCLNQFALNSTPAVALAESNSSSISIYSMYGTVLYAKGDKGFMNSCSVALLLR